MVDAGAGLGDATGRPLPVVVDAMGGDRAPGEIVAGARRAADELGIDVVLVGPPDQVGDTSGLELLSASEVIGMDEEPGQGVRRKKDSSLVRAAEAVRDGGRWPWSAPGTRGPPWPVPCCGWAG